MDHTIALIQRSHAGDKEAREQLVEENVGLVWCVVKRFYGRGTDAEDLFQIACPMRPPSNACAVGERQPFSLRGCQLSATCCRLPQDG